MDQETFNYLLSVRNRGVDFTMNMVNINPPEFNPSVLVNVEEVRVIPDDFICCICSEGETNSELLVNTFCRHIFHRKCLLEWKGFNHNTCPMCRTRNTFFGRHQKRHNR